MKSMVQYIPGRTARTLISLAFVVFAISVCIYDSRVQKAKGAITEMVPVAIQKSQEGLDRLQQEPAVKKLMEKMNPSVEAVVPDIPVEVGATEAEVEQLLGKPSGTILSPDQSVWVYGKRRIAFSEGKVVSSTNSVDESLWTEDLAVLDPFKRPFKKAEGWINDLAVSLGLVPRDLVIFGKDGIPTHRGSMVINSEKPLGTMVKDMGSNKEVAILLHKVENDHASIKGKLYEQSITP